jgi:hypothetical protein
MKHALVVHAREGGCKFFCNRHGEG